MNRALLLHVLLFLLLLVGAIDLAYHHPRLPERLATQFNAAGEPGRWTERDAFLRSQIVLLLMSGLFAAGIRGLVLVLPARAINVPHHAYWMAPERVAYTKSLIGDTVLGIGLLFVAMVIGTMHLILAANQSPNPRLDQTTMWLAACVVGTTIVVIIRLYRRFRRLDLG